MFEDDVVDFSEINIPVFMDEFVSSVDDESPGDFRV